MLAPGKSVTIVDTADTAIRVVITAPADEALDLDSLLASVGPKESIPSLATRSQVREANALVRNSDGSLTLGFADAAIESTAATVEGGVILFEEGKYAFYPDESAVRANAAGFTDGVRIVRDHIPIPGTALAGPPKPGAPSALPIVPPTIPTGGAVPIQAPAILNVSAPAVLNWSTFNVGSGALTTFGQPGGSGPVNRVNTGGVPSGR